MVGPSLTSTYPGALLLQDCGVHIEKPGLQTLPVSVHTAPATETQGRVSHGTLVCPAALRVHLLKGSRNGHLATPGIQRLTHGKGRGGIRQS